MRRFFVHLFEWLDDLLFPVIDDDDERLRQQREIRRLMSENEKLKKELRKAKRDRR